MRDGQSSKSPGEHTEVEPLSRRSFVKRVSFFGGGAVLLGACKDDKPKTADVKPLEKPVLVSSHKTFTNEEFETLSAACERILPKDEDVGAIEAGVPQYIDAMLQTAELTKMRTDFVPGVAALNRRSQRMHSVAFSKATPAQQDAVLNAFKDSDPKSGEAHFFELLTVLTLEGFLADPSYGGNKDKAGWRLVGFELVGAEKADPTKGYDGAKHLHSLHCGGGKGC